MKFLLFSMAMAFVVPIASNAQQGGRIPLSNAKSVQQTDQIILKLKTNPTAKVVDRLKTGNALVDAVSKKYKAIALTKRLLGQKNQQFVYIIKFPTGTAMEMVLDAYAKTKQLEYVELDAMGSGGGIQSIPNDGEYSRQWSLKNDGNFWLSPATVGADVKMESAWNITQGDTNTVVCILDSGCKLDHPEFSGRIWNNRREIPNNQIDDDNNGYVDDYQGWDFVNNDNNPTDDMGHGTNITGIIGATGNNNRGYAGIDWRCKLMIIKGLNNINKGYYSWWASGLYYAVDNGAKIINLSLGGTSHSTMLQTAIQYAVNHGVVVVVAMMNFNTDAICYPAGFAGVIAVGSTNANDERSITFGSNMNAGSSYGSHISVVAPGNYIFGLHHLSNVDYNYYWCGTSQATPHVTGLAALLLAQNPARTPAQIKSIIESSAQDRVGTSGEDVQGWDPYYGYGRINAYRALLKTSLQTPPQSFQLSIYPNPNRGQFEILLNAELFEMNVIIKNVLGQQVFHQKIAAGTEQVTIQLPNDANGIHWACFYRDGQLQNTQKMVVNQ